MDEFVIWDAMGTTLFGGTISLLLGPVLGWSGGLAGRRTARVRLSSP